MVTVKVERTWHLIPWQEIDGFLSAESAELVSKLVQKVPENGWIIEIGSFKGKQSSFIASTKKNTVLLSCIDPFPDNLVNLDDSRTYRHYTFADWLKSTDGYPNVEAVRNLSPFNISNIQFSKKPDLIILDIDQILESLAFWSAHAARETQFLVHTYSHEHSRIIEQLDRFTAIQNYTCVYDASCALLNKK